ncbi:MAG: TMAO reductase system periplasmic protein TorT [Thermodesulfobacteriota bacterium]
MRRKVSVISLMVVVVFALAWLAGPAAAQEKPWWPFPVVEFSTGQPKVVDYVPLEKASKKWNIVGLFPHLKDTSWMGPHYGMVEEAKRMGVKLTILDAGSYDNLNKQLSQYDDALAMGANAIIAGVISDVGFKEKLQEGKAKGVMNIIFINPVKDTPSDFSIFNDIPFMSYAAAETVLDEFKDQAKVKVALLPGPAGANWAEEGAKYFQEKLEKDAPGKYEIVDIKWGDPGKSVQLKLVEDILQAHPQVDLLWGCNPAIEAAVNVIQEMGLVGKTKLMASYETRDMLPFIESGLVLGMVGERNTAIARISVDQCVRLLENKPTGFSQHLQPVVQGITKKTIPEIQVEWSFAPEDWKPVFTVD